MSDAAVTLRELDVGAVDGDSTVARGFRHRLGDPSAALVDSVRRDGVLSPIIVVENAGRFAMVSGFRRLAACVQCGIERVWARVAPKGAGAIELLDSAVRENLAVGGLSEAERYLALARYVELGAEPGWILENAAGPLGFSARPRVLHRAVEVAGLPEAVLDALGKGELEWGHVRLLSDLPAGDVAAAVRLFGAVRLTYQQARTVLDAATALAADGEQSFANVLGEMVESSGVAGGAGGAGARLVEWVSDRRAPARAAARGRIEAALAEIETPGEVEVATDRTLEDDGVCVTVRSADADQLRRVLLALAEAVDSPSWRAAFDALHFSGDLSDA